MIEKSREEELKKGAVYDLLDYYITLAKSQEQRDLLLSFKLGIANLGHPSKLPPTKIGTKYNCMKCGEHLGYISMAHLAYETEQRERCPEYSVGDRSLHYPKCPKEVK